MKKIKEYIIHHKRFAIIIAGVILLDLVYGFDARFTIINFLWIIISISRIQ